MNQLGLPIQISVEKEVDGLQMGVLSDGRSYLTARSLARFCGVANSAVINQGARWLAGDREGRLGRMLVEAGIDTPSLYIDFGSHHAYPEEICMLFLEYYAYRAQPASQQAATAHQRLARAGLRLFVYSSIGYDPANAVPAGWKHFHDRLMLVSAPLGYFSVFKETADFVLNAIRCGLVVDDHTVPDASVGKIWARHWREKSLESRYGAKQSYPHNYPAYFPQAASNPQEMAVYPVDALGEFRRFLQSVYIPEKFPDYLDRKVKKGTLPASIAELLLASNATPDLAADGSE